MNSFMISMFTDFGFFLFDEIYIAHFYVWNFFLQIMTDNNDNLRSLNLTGCKCITNDLVIPVFNRNERLKTVDLSECHHLTDGCLQPLANQCRELKR